MPTKLKFLGFGDDPSTPKTSGADIEYEVLVNPPKFSLERKMLFNSGNRAQASRDVKQWQGYGTEILKLTIALDGVNYAADSQEDVKVQIDNIIDVIYKYNSGTHKANYTVIAWNDFAFLGHAKNIVTNYKVFNPEGKCTYGTMDLEFELHVDNKTVNKQNNANSPDMSHLQLMKDGDKIPLICNDIYNDPTYYIQIAELNGLTNFRDVPPGKRLLFPPLINE